MRIARLSCALILGVVTLASASAEDAGEVVILRTAAGDGRTDAPGSMWRYFETWRNDIARVDGKVVDVDLFENRRKEPAGGWRINEPKAIMGSPFPPDRWRQADFDDGAWIRHPGPFYAGYRRLALICLRGRFQVTDPVKAGELTLTVKFQGGAVAHVNGREIGRAFMPDGPLGEASPAVEYPLETYVTGDGKPFGEFPFSSLRAELLTVPLEKIRKPWGWNDDKVGRFKQRGRIARFKVPAACLQAGVNVLALEIHRAPADPVMFLTQQLRLGTGGLDGECWNRASVEEVTLSAPAPAAALVPNVRHPDGVRVWVEDTLAPMNHSRRFGDPNEPLRPIRICGVRNGVHAGLAVVSSRSTLRNLKASASELRQGAAVLPANAVQIAYPGIGLASDGLKSAAPAEIALAADSPAENATQPIWTMVKIPADAAPGLYSGTLTVEANGEKPVLVPVELKVVGRWAVADPKDFTAFVGIHQSPDSVALQYRLPRWSEEHWKHLERAYELLAQIGTKDLYLPLVAKTHLANEESMVRWIRQADGTYRHDFAIFERYLDTALKHLGKIPVVCLYLHDYGFRIRQGTDNASDHGGTRVVKPSVTTWDPVAGKLGELEPPEWGTPEARSGKITQPFGLVSNVSGAVGVSYNPEQWEKHCGWKSEWPIINFPRNFVTFGSCPSAYRLFAEGTLLSGTMGWRGGPAGRGLGHIGADFWPVLEGARKGDRKTLANRYVFWHSLSIDTVITSILAPSSEGTLGTIRHQLMREAQQEAEASLFVREALLDEKKRAKLGAELEARCRALCLERTWALWHYTHFDHFGAVFSQRQWEDLSEKLYALAGDVSAALGRP